MLTSRSIRLLRKALKKIGFIDNPRGVSFAVAMLAGAVIMTAAMYFYVNAKLHSQSIIEMNTIESTILETIHQNELKKIALQIAVENALLFSITNTLDNIADRVSDTLPIIELGNKKYLALQKCKNKADEDIVFPPKKYAQMCVMTNFILTDDIEEYLFSKITENTKKLYSKKIYNFITNLNQKPFTKVILIDSEPKINFNRELITATILLNITSYTPDKMGAVASSQHISVEEDINIGALLNTVKDIARGINIDKDIQDILCTVCDKYPQVDREFLRESITTKLKKYEKRLNENLNSNKKPRISVEFMPETEIYIFPSEDIGHITSEAELNTYLDKLNLTIKPYTDTFDSFKNGDFAINETSLKIKGRYILGVYVVLKISISTDNIFPIKIGDSYKYQPLTLSLIYTDIIWENREDICTDKSQC